ncbi:MAG: hypothetical protein IT442_09350 [Phycisphaeraceae bacterium]|nr:hypothetical protein [Phycisphaeraceae bacterium]
MSHGTRWLGVCAALSLMIGPAKAQDVSSRIAQVRVERAAQAMAQDEARLLAQVEVRLASPIGPVQLSNVPAREALSWWRRTTGLPLVVDWRALRMAGFDPSSPVTIQLERVPAKQVLELITDQMAASSTGLTGEPTSLVIDWSAWYVRVMTKQEANQRLVTMVYDVGEAVHEAPSFADAPRMDLSSALSTGGDGGGATFEQNDAAESPPTKQQRGERLAEVVRQMVEPTVWRESGGPASVRYDQGKLIVSAPMYVQRQIGRAVPGVQGVPGASQVGVAGGGTRAIYTGVVGAGDPRYVGITGGSATAAPPTTMPSYESSAPSSMPRTSNGVAGIDPQPAAPVARRASP